MRWEIVFVECCKNADATMHHCVEQLQTLYKNYDLLTPVEKGTLIGYTVSKYGIEIFSGYTAFKGLAAYKNLRDANRLCTFEAMTMSNANKEALITSALNHNACREHFFKDVKIHWDRQNKHIPGMHNYESQKSILTHSDPEQLLKKNAGKGYPIKGEFGSSQYIEIVDFKEPVGIWKSPDGLNSLSTTKGTIHYSPSGGSHIIPAHPDSKIYDVLKKDI